MEPKLKLAVSEKKLKYLLWREIFFFFQIFWGLGGCNSTSESIKAAVAATIYLVNMDHHIHNWMLIKSKRVLEF